MSKAITDSEKREFYKNCPAYMCVKEIRELNIQSMRYFTVKLKYVCVDDC